MAATRPVTGLSGRTDHRSHSPAVNTTRGLGFGGHPRTQTDECCGLQRSEKAQEFALPLLNGCPNLLLVTVPLIDGTYPPGVPDTWFRSFSVMCTGTPREARLVANVLRRS